MQTTEPGEPWRAFPKDLDERLQGPVELRCLGGFVVAQQYGIGRETSDIDFLSAITELREDDAEHLAGFGSELHRRHRLYLQYVGIVTPPSGYADRLSPMFPSAPWKRLRLVPLDAIDLALSKVERNSERDREDFLRLARAGLVDADAFKERHIDEVRPYLLGNIPWHDKTVDLWTEMASTIR